MVLTATVTHDYPLQLNTAYWKSSNMRLPVAATPTGPATGFPMTTTFTITAAQIRAYAGAVTRFEVREIGYGQTGGPPTGIQSKTGVNECVF